ncbi:citramalate synthase [Streptomyces sp. PsTaAH-124]|uniref:citramalate synthase n=1 Tax=Streptomyces sp. PsTaAH-124 TaxID=1157638 RepID=UPI00036B627A|nr:citramalate synthase [Streptomyces sp. PsTaAH-124]
MAHTRTTPADTPLGDDFHLYDTTLRDGAQREGISYSVAEKLTTARTLDALGVGFIEGGWPGALPKDTAFFARATDELHLKHAALVAFGSTRKPGRSAEQDPQVRALLDSRAPVITLVAKSDRRHIERALRTDVAENCAMVRDTVRLLVAEGRRVFLDAEHFFDGYAADPATALRVLDAAMGAGADVAVLCDTNGGQLPGRLAETVGEVAARTGFRIGIHCQDDTGCAVANTIAAVEAGATHVQCTANGYGERAGNADLFAVIGNLTTKLGMPVVPRTRLGDLTRTAHALAETAHISPDRHQPYVGAAAFAHKAGLHASAIKVDPALYHHIDPDVVGNGTRILVSEMAGRTSLELKCLELGFGLDDLEALSRAVARIKRLEAGGWSFEAADASLELLLHDELTAGEPGGQGGPGRPFPPFTPLSYQVVERRAPDGAVVSEAMVRLSLPDAEGAEGTDGNDGMDGTVGSAPATGRSTREATATAEGNGPLEALDAALRRALAPHLPWLDEVRLADHSVRVLDAVAERSADGSADGTALTRVLVVSRDAEREWTTTGVHASVVVAAMQALTDALAHKALRAPGRPRASVPAS